MSWITSASVQVVIVFWNHIHIVEDDAIVIIYLHHFFECSVHDQSFVELPEVKLDPKNKVNHFE